MGDEYLGRGSKSFEGRYLDQSLANICYRCREKALLQDNRRWSKRAAADHDKALELDLHVGISVDRGCKGHTDSSKLANLNHWLLP